jgi:hypothetical protein
VDGATPSEAPKAWAGGIREIEGNQLLGALRAGSCLLDANVAAVNALNVFPVPDGDTGTNMSLTMRAALAETGERAFDSVSELGRVISHGALMGARGNSGVILSQILRGFARGLDAKPRMSTLDFAIALQEGAVTAYKGVMKPVEGTILTVVREAAEAARQVAEAGADMIKVFEYTMLAARESVQRTPSLLKVLADAGVVDAGGQGLAVILEGMLRHARGESAAMVTLTGVTVQQHVHVGEERYNYDTQFIIMGTGLDVATIRARIAEMGDSVLVVGDPDTVKVHVHTDNPGAAVDYGITQGAIDHIIVENMQLQSEAFRAAQASPRAISGPAALITPAESLSEIGIVAVVSGSGLEKVFESLGVNAIVHGGQTMNPCTQDLLDAANSLPNEQVIILPNNGNIILAAQQAIELASKTVTLVPTRTVPQGIAALLAFNYQSDLATNVDVMKAASEQVETLEVTQAVRNAQVNSLAIREGQFIGLLDDDLVTVGETVDEVVQSLMERIDVADYEIITVYYGSDVTGEQASEIGDLIQDAYPDLEVEVLDGGQAHYHYIISAE